jgi:hypothetical protein
LKAALNTISLTRQIRAFDYLPSSIFKLFLSDPKSKWLLLNVNSAICLATCISWQNQVNFQWDDDVCFVLDPTHLVHWNNSLQIDMSCPLGYITEPTSLCFLLNAACLAKKQQIPIFWPDQCSNPRSTTLRRAR